MEAILMRTTQRAFWRYNIRKLRKTKRGYHLNDLRNAAEQAGLHVWNRGAVWGADIERRRFWFWRTIDRLIVTGQHDERTATTALLDCTELGRRLIDQA